MHSQGWSSLPLELSIYYVVITFVFISPMSWAKLETYVQD